MNARLKALAARSTKWPGIRHTLDLLWVLEAVWFDKTRRVYTSGATTLEGLTLVGKLKDASPYIPVRPSTARSILRDLPIQDHSQYTFVDFGSGRGRMLLIAAEHPFREILGVEFALELHADAEKNIASYHSSRRKCPRIRSLSLDAVDFVYPGSGLVIYFFNPFGYEVMANVLQNLDASLASNPREAIVVMLFPDFACLLDARPTFALWKEACRHRIYRYQNQSDLA